MPSGTPFWTKTPSRCAAGSSRGPSRRSGLLLPVTSSSARSVERRRDGTPRRTRPDHRLPEVLCLLRRVVLGVGQTDRPADRYDGGDHRQDARVVPQHRQRTASGRVSIRIFGAVLVAIALAWLAMYLWLQFAKERMIRELQEEYARRRPILEPWEEPTVLPSPYDWQRRGDFDG